jgi:hypothetical protein
MRRLTKTDKIKLEKKDLADLIEPERFSLWHS